LLLSLLVSDLVIVLDISQCTRMSLNKMYLVVAVHAVQLV
jgi:hypothetical protein